MADNEAQDLRKLKVADLKSLLKKQGLSTAGNKSELIDRLEGAPDTASGEVDELDEDVLDDAEVDAEVDDEEIEEEILEESEPEKTLELSEEKENTTETKTNNADEVSPITSDTEQKPEKVAITAAPNSLEDRAKRFGVVTTDEKVKIRAARFGAVSVDAKIKARSERFGTVTEEAKKVAGKSAAPISSAAPITPVSSVEYDKLSKRADRFGSSVSSLANKVEEVDKLKKRADRFGAVISPTLEKTADNEKIAKRKERFGAVAPQDEQAKKKIRAQRFNVST